MEVVEVMHRSPLHIAHVHPGNPHEVDVIDTNEIAYGFIQVAMELWQLAGRGDRASAIKKVVASSVDYEPERLEGAQIQQLRKLLDGLEEELVGTLTDEQHLLSAAKVEELRGRTETLDLSETFGSFRRDPREAVQEALIHVHTLRAILDDALAANACILFD